MAINARMTSIALKAIFPHPPPFFTHFKPDPRCTRELAEASASPRPGPSTLSPAPVSAAPSLPLAAFANFQSLPSRARERTATSHTPTVKDNVTFSTSTNTNTNCLEIDSPVHGASGLTLGRPSRQDAGRPNKAPLLGQGSASQYARTTPHVPPPSRSNHHRNTSSSSINNIKNYNNGDTDEETSAYSSIELNAPAKSRVPPSTDSPFMTHSLNTSRLASRQSRARASPPVNSTVASPHDRPSLQRLHNPSSPHNPLASPRSLRVSTARSSSKRTGSHARPDPSRLGQSLGLVEDSGDRLQEAAYNGVVQEVGGIGPWEKHMHGKGIGIDNGGAVENRYVDPAAWADARDKQIQLPPNISDPRTSAFHHLPQAFSSPRSGTRDASRFVVRDVPAPEPTTLRALGGAPNINATSRAAGSESLKTPGTKTAVFSAAEKERERSLQRSLLQLQSREGGNRVFLLSICNFFFFLLHFSMCVFDSDRQLLATESLSLPARRRLLRWRFRDRSGTWGSGSGSGSGAASNPGLRKSLWIDSFAANCFLAAVVLAWGVLEFFHVFEVSLLSAEEYIYLQYSTVGFFGLEALLRSISMGTRYFQQASSWLDLMCLTVDVVNLLTPYHSTLHLLRLLRVSRAFKSNRPKKFAHADACGHITNYSPFELFNAGYLTHVAGSLLVLRPIWIQAVVLVTFTTIWAYNACGSACAVDNGSACRGCVSTIDADTRSCRFVCRYCRCICSACILWIACMYFMYAWINDRHRPQLRTTHKDCFHILI
jgi:hypothetical protein